MAILAAQLAKVTAADTNSTITRCGAGEPPAHLLDYSRATYGVVSTETGITEPSTYASTFTS